MENKNISFAEYRAQVIRAFYKVSGYSEKDATPFLNSSKVESKIKSSYKYFTSSDIGGFEPSAVASCLDMMFE